METKRTEMFKLKFFAENNENMNQHIRKKEIKYKEEKKASMRHYSLT
jgi:hypothetical protein